MRFPLPLTAKIAACIISKKLRGVEKFATVLQLEPLHTCNLDLHRVRPDSRILNVRLKDVMTPRGLPRDAAQRVRRANGFHLRRRTTYLSAILRRWWRGLLGQTPHCLHLHERNVHAKKNARLPGAEVAEARVFRKQEEPGLNQKLEMLLSEEPADARSEDRGRFERPKTKTVHPVIAPSASGCPGTSIWTASSARAT